MHTPPEAKSHLTLLHTSDWHLGHTLYGRKRHAEAAAFLDWLADTLDREDVDVLLVAGDIFDTAMPDTTAQRLYYDFLCRTFANPRRHVVITSGNHDSPAFLAAPRDLLHRLRVHVLASGDNPARQAVTLRREDGSPLCAVCAVPYLRDRDLCPPEAGVSPDERDRKLLQAMHDHYEAVATHARQAIPEHSSPGIPPVPVIAMGHLFASGGVADFDEGVRELYVGSLSRVGSDLFPAGMDYVALGHLHTAQIVNKQEHIRYSGAPLVMGPAERRSKSVTLVRFGVDTPVITSLPVPRTQRMERASGDKLTLENQIRELATESLNNLEKNENQTAPAAPLSIWVEVEYTGDEAPGDLRSRLEKLAQGSGVDILRVLDRRTKGPLVLHRAAPLENLEDLRPEEVFERRLDAGTVAEDLRPDLRELHKEILLTALARIGISVEAETDDSGEPSQSLPEGIAEGIAEGAGHANS